MSEPIRIRNAKVYIDGKEIGQCSFGEMEKVEGPPVPRPEPVIYDFDITVPISMADFADLERSFAPKAPTVLLHIPGGRVEAFVWDQGWKNLFSPDPPTAADYRWARRRPTRAQRRIALNRLDGRRAAHRWLRREVRASRAFVREVRPLLGGAP